MTDHEESTMTLPASSSTARVRRFRERHQRIDFVVAEDVLRMLYAYRARHPTASMSEILNAAVRSLWIRQGHRETD